MSQLTHHFTNNVTKYFPLLLVLLTHCGKVFTFGLASQGQLGHGGTKNLSQVRIEYTNSNCTYTNSLINE